MKTLIKYIIAALIAFAVSTISAGATASEVKCSTGAKGWLLAESLSTIASLLD